MNQVKSLYLAFRSLTKTVFKKFAFSGPKMF